VEEGDAEAVRDDAPEHRVIDPRQRERRSEQGAGNAARVPADDIQRTWRRRECTTTPPALVRAA
jgi:hypothetical protein